MNLCTDPNTNQCNSGSADAADSQQSPPDRIVASYAVAAHAAALANHQPVSKAAEVFLAATAPGRPRHPKRLRNHTTVSTVSRLETYEKPTASASLDVESAATISTNSSNLSVASGRRGGWTRITDRKAGSVVYISPDGFRLRNKEEVYTYFRSVYPTLTEGRNYEELVASCFVFEPTIDTPSFEDGLSFLSALRPNQAVLANPASEPSGSPRSSPACMSAGSEKNTAKLATSTGSVVEDSPVSVQAKASSTVCRISFNPNHAMIGMSVPNKRPRLSDAPSEPGNATEDTSFLPAVSSCPLCSDRTATISTPSDSHSSVLSPLTTNPNPASTDTGIELTGAITVSCQSCVISPDVSTYVSSSETCDGLSAGQGTAISDLSSLSLPALDVSPAVCTSLRPASVSSSVNVSSVLSNGLYRQAADDSVAKMTTETLTTCTLHSSIPSCDLAVVPSAVPSSERSLVGGENRESPQLRGLIPDSCMFNPASISSDNANHLLALSQLLANSRLAQHQQQQQQLATAVMASLSGGSGLNQQYPTMAVGSLNGNLHLAHFLLGAQTQCVPSWPMQSVTTWPEIANGAAVMPTLSGLQPQLIAAAAFQQQQAQAAAVARTAALLQRQQQAIAVQQQQQQQQALTAAQVQSYLSALQRQIPDNPQ
ncbi:unnamed protein product [Calicophoron daubneyi]|uniref:MBD domain-containing protein n=1 Tax=Calicophoron daubneyi TaxID=300641 RepID=A0AAV2TE54_CALDB